jgi:hypothetical protein
MLCTPSAQYAGTTATNNFNTNLQDLRGEMDLHLARAPRSLSRKYVLKQMDKVELRMKNGEAIEALKAKQ